MTTAIPPKNVSPVVRELFGLAGNENRRELCKRAGVYVEAFTAMHRCSPNLVTLETLGEVLGYRLKWERIEG